MLIPFTLFPYFIDNLKDRLHVHSIGSIDLYVLGISRSAALLWNRFFGNIYPQGIGLFKDSLIRRLAVPGQ